MRSSSYTRLTVLTTQVAGPTVWNGLLSHLQRGVSYERFKRLLKAFLFGVSLSRRTVIA